MLKLSEQSNVERYAHILPDLTDCCGDVTIIFREEQDVNPFIIKSMLNESCVFACASLLSMFNEFFIFNLKWYFVTSLKAYLFGTFHVSGSVLGTDHIAEKKVTQLPTYETSYSNGDERVLFKKTP